MAFMEIDVEGGAYVVSKIGRIAAQVGVMRMTMPDAIGRDIIQDVIFPAVVAATPVLSGALRDQADWRDVTTNPEEATFEIISTAENDRTGYNYAKARAYGFHTVDGGFWYPFEDPPFPVQAANDSVDTYHALAEQKGYEIMMQLGEIWH